MRNACDRRKLNKIHTPLGIDQLEARMLCAIDTASELLLSLNAFSVGATSKSLQTRMSNANRAPTISQAISLANPTQPIERSVALRVLGADDGGASALVYRWSVTSTTQGASGSFSVNGTNSARNTTLTFSRAGTYDVRVTVSDRGGLSVSSTRRITVSPILTSIQVTPGTASVAGGQTQQFTARGLDQFQQPLARQPSFTWSTTAGSVSNTGLFTAPSTAANVTITARSLAISGAARATVTASTPNLPSTGFQNAAIASLVNTYFADGSINRTEMIQLLRSAGNNGSVDSTELNDLRTVVTNASSYNIPHHVRILANNVVNTNPANSRYLGQTAGNLAVGSTTTQLNNLVDKWFLGTDLPTLTSNSITYQTAAGALFNGTPSRNDMKQGQLGDCYFIATLGAIADRNPTAIANMFVDNGDGTFTVRFYTGVYGSVFNPDGSISDGFRTGTGSADYVTVNRRLPAYSNGTLAYSGSGWSVNDTSKSLWIALAEKAYAQWNATGKSDRDGTNSYASIEGGWMGVVNAQVLGYNSTSYSFNAQGQTALLAALGANRAVTLGTRSGASAGGLVGGHAYTVTGYNSSTQTFTLTNPWGMSHPTPLTWAQLQANCDMFVVANPTTTTPIVSASPTPIVRSSSIADAGAYSLTREATPFTDIHDDLTVVEERVERREGDAADRSLPVIDELLEQVDSVFEQVARAAHDNSSSSEQIDQALTSMIESILIDDAVEGALA